MKQLRETAKAVSFARTKGKGQSDFSDWPLFNAGNDLRSHTIGACSTIGPAGLNLRRLEGVSARSLRRIPIPTLSILQKPTRTKLATASETRGGFMMDDL